MIFSSLAMAVAQEGGKEPVGVGHAIGVFFLWLLILIFLNPWPTAIYHVVAGLFGCFLAYRYLAVSIVFWGIVYGAGVGAMLAFLNPGTPAAWKAAYMLIGAVVGVGAILLLFRLSQFLLGAIWSAVAMAVALSIVPIPVPFVRGVLILGAAIYGGWQAYKRKDEVYIVTSAIWGAGLAVRGVITIVLLTGAGGNALAEFFIGLGGSERLTWEHAETDEQMLVVLIRTIAVVVLSVAGMLVQFRFKNGQWWVRSLRGTKSADEEAPIPDVHPDAAEDAKEFTGYGWSKTRTAAIARKAEAAEKGEADGAPEVQPGPLLEPRGKKITITLTKKPDARAREEGETGEKGDAPTGGPDA